MKKNRKSVWFILSNYLPTGLTILTAAVAVFINTFGSISSEVMQSVTISLLALLGIQQLLTTSNQLDNINLSLQDLREHVGHESVITFNSSEDAIEYMMVKMQFAKSSVSQASIDKLRTYNKHMRARYESAREKLILSDTVKYRYIGMVDIQRRFSAVRKYMEKKRLNNFYAAFFIKHIEDVPLMSFTVFDMNEVIIRVPYEYGEDMSYLAIKNKDIVNLFSGYFDKIWQECIKIKDVDELDAVLSSIPATSDTTIT